MSQARFAVVQYCDDVRQETGHKVSLMGCYGGELLVDKLPAVLPKLCAQVKVCTEITEPLETAVVRAFLDDDVLGQLELPVGDANKRLRRRDNDAATRLTYGAIMTFSPFVFEREGVLRVEVETETGILKAGRLRLMLVETHRRLQESSGDTVPAA